MTRKKETKIVILGSYNSGKTTTLENLCDKKTKIEYNGTTIALDYGNIKIDGEKVHIFGSPGQERFEFMREILSKGLDGAILVIDSQKGVTGIDETILNNLNQMDVPYVVFANKQDLHPETQFKGLDSDVQVVPTIATQCKGVKDGLNLLYGMIKN